MASMPTAPVVAVGLVGGFAAARFSGRRPAGGAVLATSGVWCGLRWLGSVGPTKTGVLSATYVAAFGVSHPLAKKIGAWPSVLSVAAFASAATYVLGDRPRAVDARC